jgi:hypothetical protein
MAMRMLAAGGMPLAMDGIRAADDDNPKGYFEDERVKDLEQDRDKRWLREARGKAIKVVSSLLEALPDSNNYRVLFMNRNLQEVLVSQATMLVRRGEAPGPSDEHLLESYQRHLVKVKTAIRMRPGFEVCEIEYRDVVENPRLAALRIAEFLRRPLDVDGMARAVEPELYRNRR